MVDHMAAPAPMLETRSITKAFGALKANEDVSINLRQGEIHAIIGPNGAGKSTLIQQICGALTPDSGEVLLDGENITPLKAYQRARKGLARTFQVSALAMEDTVLENAVLGTLGAQAGNGPGVMAMFSRALGNHTLCDAAMEALERVGLQHKASVRTSQLSHGERRQLELAVALTLKPRVFVMDEPMAGLGTSGSKAITEFLNHLRHEAPILLVEHDMDAVFALADRISVLVYGRIIATGTVDEIRTDAGVREAYLGEDA